MTPRFGVAGVKWEPEEEWEKELAIQPWFNGDERVKDFIRSKLAEERKDFAEKVKEKLEVLDYYWQREHQDRVLISLDDALAALKVLEEN